MTNSDLIVNNNPYVTATRPDMSSLNFDVIEKSMALEILDQKHYELADDLQGMIASIKKTIEEKYLPFVDAANKAHKGLTKARREDLEKFDAARKNLDEKMLEFRKTFHERQEQNRAIKNNDGIAPIVKSLPKTEHTLFKSKWVFDVEDIKKIPREYLIVDETKIQKLINAQGEGFKCPGIKVSRIESTTVRS